MNLSGGGRSGGPTPKGFNPKPPNRGDLMATDLTRTPTTDAAPGPFVRVYIDDAGRAVIALDAAAVNELSSLLDIVDLHDMMMNPSYHGLDADDANSMTDVAFRIRAALSNLYR